MTGFVFRVRTGEGFLLTSDLLGRPQNSFLPLILTISSVLQFKRQNKDYEKTRTRIMEIANYVDKVKASLTADYISPDSRLTDIVVLTPHVFSQSIIDH